MKFKYWNSDELFSIYGIKNNTYIFGEEQKTEAKPEYTFVTNHFINLNIILLSYCCQIFTLVVYEYIYTSQCSVHIKILFS